MPQIGVSSSLVRDRVRDGRPIRYLVPDAVRELIEAEGLYREDRPGRRTRRLIPLEEPVLAPIHGRESA